MTPHPARLTLLMRIEPGCLGPDGKLHIATFCAAATRLFAASAPQGLCWQLIPRHDKRLPELSFLLQDQTLTAPQAERYLQRLGLALAPLREQADERLPELVDRYLKTLGSRSP